MSTAIIHLVRHAEVENPDHVVYAGLDGFGLSRLGRSQARATAEYLAGRDIGAVVTSPLLRARQTASAIAEATAAPVRIDERLTEWALATRWAGVAWDQLAERFPGEVEMYLDDPARIDFADETLEEAAHRVETAVQDHRRSAGAGELAFVSHQDPVHAGVRWLTGRGFEDFNAGKPGHGTVITLQDNGSWEIVSVWSPPQGRIFPPPK